MDKQEKFGSENKSERIRLLAAYRSEDAYVQAWHRYYLDRPQIRHELTADILGEIEGVVGQKTDAGADADYAVDADTEAVYQRVRDVERRFSSGDTISAADVAGIRNELSAFALPPTPHVLLVHAVLRNVLRAMTSNTPKIDLTPGGEPDNDLAEVALVLPEDEREAFIAGFPAEIRREVSALLDYHASGVLHSNVTTTPFGPIQAEKIESRAAEQLQSLMKSDEYLQLPQVLKLVCLTLCRLDTNDSVHIVSEAVKLGLDKDAIIKKGEDTKTFNKRWMAFARMLKAQSEVYSQVSNAGMTALKFLALAHIPDKLFSYFLHKMVQTGYLSRNFLAFPVSDPDNKTLIRTLIITHPGQCNTIVDTLSQIKGFSAGKDMPVVLEALEHLPTILPVTFRLYAKSSPYEKRRLLEKLSRNRALLYTNTPHDRLATSDTAVPIEEQMYMAFLPINMSYEWFTDVLPKVTDKSAEFDSLAFDRGGYTFKLVPTAPLKEGETVAVALVEQYRSLVASSMEERRSDESVDAEYKAILQSLADGHTLKPGSREIGLLLSLCHGAQGTKSLDDVTVAVTQENAFGSILSIEPYFEDPDRQAVFLKNVLRICERNPEFTQRIIELLGRKGRYAKMRQSIASTVKQGFKLDDDLILPESLTSAEDVSVLLTAHIFSSIFKADRLLLSKEKKKYRTERGSREKKVVDNLRATFSATAASFFARAGVGICTFEDVVSWKNPGRFHINIDEDGEHLRANVQGLMTEINGKKMMLLRGFNPSSTFLRRVEPGALCEKILDIADSVAKENGLDGVYITEQAEWHSLSNREPVSKYLTQAYISPSEGTEKEIVLKEQMEMARTVGVQYISKIYKVR